MNKIAKNIFDKKYLPLLKQMYMIGFNDGFGLKLDNLLYDIKGDKRNE